VATTCGKKLVLAEQKDEWAISRRHMSQESLAEVRMKGIEGEGEAVGRRELGPPAEHGIRPVCGSRGLPKVALGAS
jgi:hypothetical protein